MDASLNNKNRRLNEHATEAAQRVKHRSSILVSNTSPMSEKRAKGIGPAGLRFALGLLLAASTGFLTASHSWAQAQLPPGFYSFAPSKQEVPIGQLSASAQSDLNAALAAYRAKDFTATMPYLARPSQEGSIQANWLLGHMYRKGLGVPANLATAFKHYYRVAEDYIDHRSEVSGNERYFVLDSLTRTANYLRKGNKKAGIKKNIPRALHFYQTAASAGHAGAQYGFGIMYLNGEGVTMDRSYGMRWLGTAAQKRYAPAASLLGDIYEDTGDSIRAMVWYRIAADTASRSLKKKISRKYDKLAAVVGQDQLDEVSRLYKKWSNRFPVRTRQAQN